MYACAREMLRIRATSETVKLAIDRDPLVARDRGPGWTGVGAAERQAQAHRPPDTSGI
jgi:hypothetical protein